MAAPGIAFLRPHLGIGGSERLVLDAATQLQSRGCRVRFFVPGPCTDPQFSEVSQGLVPISSVATWLPAHVGGRVRAPLAVLRTAKAARTLATNVDAFDLVFCDVVPHVIPLVKRLTSLPVLYFCHFPDLLLTPLGWRKSLAYRLYRRPLDALEVAGVLAADTVVVNSHFTASVVRQWIPALTGEHVQVVHPGVRLPAVPRPWGPVDGDDIQLLSISRFDPRKNLALAIESLAALRQVIPAELFARVRLVLAGNYDGRLAEQRCLVEELRRLAQTLDVTEHVRVICSPSEGERDDLLATSRCVLFTPRAEHFGYVPLEAMAAGRPVVAADQGGPTETVLDGVTGLLSTPTPDAFAAALRRFVVDPELAERFGRSGVDHVVRNFSLDAFGKRLQAVIAPLLERASVTPTLIPGPQI
jgi:alpha-1,3/alpha-1,6-mannosyltransferase